MGWFPKLRRAWILERARVHGFVNLGHVVEVFGVSRSQASADVAELVLARPDALRYDLTQRAYLWTGDDFAPVGIPPGVSGLSV